jgi:hypothetical protein
MFVHVADRIYAYYGCHAQYWTNEDVTLGQQFIKLVYRAFLKANFSLKEAVVLLLS